LRGNCPPRKGFPFEADFFIEKFMVIRIGTSMISALAVSSVQFYFDSHKETKYEEVTTRSLFGKRRKIVASDNVYDRLEIKNGEILLEYTWEEVQNNARL
jgi:hypothetical protein